MLNIDSLITTYSWMLESLKEIRKKEEELKTIEFLKQELKKSRQKCEELEGDIKWNKKHIIILSCALWEKICPDCWWEGWFEWHEWDGWPCETCKTSWIIPLK